MMRNKITRSDTNDDTDHQDRAAKKMRLTVNGGFMNLLHHEGGTSNNLSVHARLMNLCQHDIQLKQPTGPTKKLNSLQTQVTNLGSREKSQLLQNMARTTMNSSNVDVSTLIHSVMADYGRTLQAMNNVNTTVISSLSQQFPQFFLPQMNSTRMPLKLHDVNDDSSNMRNRIGNVDSSPPSVAYQQQPNMATPSMSQTMIPYLLPLSMMSSATIASNNNFHGIRSITNVIQSMTEERSIPSQLPACLAQPADQNVLSEHQQFLRFQIEVFEATEADVRTHVRGRNKPIVLGQVGIRCRHCAHLAAARRQNGSTYFPASTIGLYQAAQNMCTAHIQCGMCSQMPDYIKEHFKGLIATKSFTSGAGKPYWSKSAKSMGLVDTENGIFFNRSSLSSK